LQEKFFGQKERHWVLFVVGPAGTGKTESVKALGNQLGRFVLVFNCDETFDFQVCLFNYLQER
jgi:MoxR-like ATPase